MDSGPLPQYLITDHSKAVILLQFSFDCIDASFGDVLPYLCTGYLLAEWPPLWEELLSRLTVCSMSICYFNYFPFWF